MTILRTREKTFDLTKETLVMGILNVTPDSFSDGGQFDEVEVAIKQAKQMQQDGAHIIDVGGESTRPGHDPVTEQEELKRVLPIIRAVRQEVDIPISIDTYKSEVARQALEAGASIINDVWGAKRDPQMAQVAAAYQVPIILMHNREDRHYANLIEDMKKDLQESIDLAKDAGVRDENILLDPGVGFAKTPEQNVEVMGHLSEVVSLGYPVLLGTSRKSFIGQVLDLPVEERMEGTGATVCYGMTQGIDLVRVHDVKPIARMTKMMDKMLGKGSD